MSEETLNLRMAQAITSAMDVYWALENLREGDQALAIETLERHLDSTILILGALFEQLPHSDQNRVVETLRCIRGYRRDHPRQIEPKIEKMDNAEFADFDEVQRRVRKILDETARD